MKEKVMKQFIIFTSIYAMSHMITMGIYVTYLQSKGMNLLQVNLINAVYFSFLFLTEVPTGAFADLCGRKRSIVIACVLRTISEVIYGLSDSFFGFISGEIIAALGYTFMSGACQAWLVDSLHHRGYEVVDNRVFGRVKSYSQLMGMGGCIFGSYLGGISLSIPWFVGAVFALAAGIYVSCMIGEEYFVPEKFSLKQGYGQIKKIIASSMHYATTDKAVRFILVITFIQVFSVQAFNMFWQPFFGSHGVERVNFGWIIAGMLGCLALGARLAEIVGVQADERFVIIKSQILVGTIILCTLFFSHWFVLVILFLLHEVGRGFWEPMRDSYLHKRIPSHERATISSFCSMSPCIGGAFGLVVSGMVAQFGSISLSWAVSSIILIVGALLVVRNNDLRSSK